MILGYVYYLSNVVTGGLVIMEPKKISFSFNKVIRNFIPNKLKIESENKVELIKCLEEQSIKLVNQEQDVEEKPLVIPMKNNRKTAAALASLKLRQEILSGDVTNAVVDKKEDVEKIELKRESESIEQKAITELIKEARGEDTEGVEVSTLALPVKPDELPLEGATEPSLDDYENIPITQFGLAMLRGMGWKDEDKKDSPKDIDGPPVRPKGMGLGADKVLKLKPLIVPPEKNEKLEIKKNAFVRILGGKYKDMYGQIEGLDDHAGRVVVKLALGGNRESLNEFMVQPVSKGEYAQCGKVINSAKYEEYKKMENQHGQIIIKPQNIKTENDLSDEDERKYKRENSSAKDRRVQHSPHSDDCKFVERTYSRRNNKREDEDGHVKIKTEHREEKKVRSDRSRSRNNNDESRAHKSSTSRRDQSSDSEDYRKSKKKSKKKNRERERYRHDSPEDDKRHKKKTKKSKKPRSRSRERR